MKMRAISMCEMLKLLGQMAPRNLWLGGAALAALTVLVATHDAQLAAAMDRVIELPLLRRVQEPQP